MNEAVLSPWVSYVSDPDPTKPQDPLTSFSPKRNATDHRFSSVAGCATSSTRPSSAHNRSGLQSLYFGLFLYQVHRVATVAGVSRRLACVELRRIHLLRLSEKGKRSLPCSLTEHQNGTFRPIFASQHVQIRAQSVVRTPFRTVSPRTRVNKEAWLCCALGLFR